MLMFWGLVLEPAKRYTQKVQQSFHLSQAALELSDGDQEPIQLILEFEGANYVLGTLSRKASLFQVPLDLNFNTGDQISFRTIGRGRVHLTGYHIAEEDMNDVGTAETDLLNDERIRTILAKSLMGKGKRKRIQIGRIRKAKRRRLGVKKESEGSDDESLEDDASEEDTSFGETLGSEEEEEEESEDNDEEDESDEDENEEEDSDEDDDIPTKGKKGMYVSSKKSVIRVNGKSPKKKKSESPKLHKSPKKNVSPSTKGSKDKTPKSEKKSPKGEKKDHNKHDITAQKKVVEGGVIIEEMKIGDGAVAKPGKMAQVYYVGRLQSNKKQFDATTQGPGFRFRLGKGEVIRGWDIGVNGMKVGGKRKITIPSQLGYGSKGAPPAIPPNAVLIFEIELKSIN